jgi:hypothetical protein
MNNFHFSLVSQALETKELKWREGINLRENGRIIMANG